MNYNLKINDKQAKIISMALNFYSRMIGAQFQCLLDIAGWEKEENYREAERLLDEVKMLLTGLDSNVSPGIGMVSNEAKIAYDLHQVIRHRLAWDENPEGDFLNVFFDTPMQVSDQPLAKISKE